MPLRRLLVFGDSHAYGWHDAANNGWAGLVQGEMTERFVRKHSEPDQHPGPIGDVRNLAVVGRPLTAYIDRLPELLREWKLGKTVCIFMLGGAESGIRPGSVESSVPLALFKSALEKVASACITAEVLPIFVSLPPCDDSRSPLHNGYSFSSLTRREYDEAVRDHALKAYNDASPPFVDLYDLFRGLPYDEYLAYDGMHLSTAGHIRAFEAIMPVVDKLLNLDD